jgi:hypothetical protein
MALGEVAAVSTHGLLLTAPGSVVVATHASGAAHAPGLASQLAAAIPLALVAGFSPTTLAVLVYYLRAERPLRPILAFLAGATLITVAVAVAGLLVLGSTHITPRRHRTPSAGVDLVLGVAALGLAIYLDRRRRRPRPPPKPRPRSVGAAFLLGVVFYVPSLFYLAALKNISDTEAHVLPLSLATLLLVLLDLITIEAVVVLYLLQPEWTRRQLELANDWARRNGPTVLVAAACGAGTYLVFKGIYRLLA